MEYLNIEVAEFVFRLKNDICHLTNEVSWPIASRCQVRTDWMVDLHGLYVDEALECIKKEFQSALLGNNKVIRFIAGMPSL